MTEPSIASYLGRWEEAYAAGEDLPPEALCPDRPDLHRALRSVCDMMRWMRKDPDATATAPTAGGVDAVPGPIAGHEILGELARGGMGVVYRARHVALNRVVALKMILGGGHADAEARRRFLTEAEAVARVRHPNIVQIFDHGTHDGLPYFSLELCAGSLAGRLADGPLPPREAAALVEKVARAVQAAHEAGIVHRDLKPANVLLADDGSPRVADFGLARRLDAASSLPSGAVVGTPSFMAPEQARGGRNVGPAADVYALGAVLYACLTGGPPFRSASVMDTLAQVIAAEPAAPRALNPAVPRDLETVCLKAMQKEGWRRYPSAAAFADDLKRFTEGRPVSARPVGPLGQLVRWCGRQPVIAALTAGLALALIAGTAASVAFAWRAADKAALAEEKAGEAKRKEAEAALREAEANEQRDRAELLLYAGNLTLAQREWRDGSAARAAELLALCPPRWRGWEHRYLWRQYAAGSRVLRKAEHTSALGWSPDGKQVAVGAQQGVSILDVATGTEVRRLPGTGLGKIILCGWGKGGRLAVLSYGGAARLHGAPGEPPLVIDGEHLAGALSPDRTRVATVTILGKGPGQRRWIKVWAADTGREEASFDLKIRNVPYLAWSPDGKSLAAASYDGTLHIHHPAGGATRVLADTRGDVRFTSVSWSADGAALITGSNDRLVQSWPLADGKPRLLAKSGTGGRQAAWAPVGSRYLIIGQSSITVRDPEADAPVSLRGHPGAPAVAVWSPDGRRVLSADPIEVRVWDLAYHARKDRIEARDVNDFVWSPRGRVLAFCHGDKGITLRVVDAGAGKDRAFIAAHALGGGLAWRPDARRLAAAGRGGVQMIFDAETGAFVRTLGTPGKRGFGGGVWSPDGTRLAAIGGDGRARVFIADTGVAAVTLEGEVSNENGHLAWCGPSILRLEAGGLRRWDADTGAATWIRLEGVPAVSALALSPDGTRAAVAYGREIALWDVDGPRRLFTLRGHSHEVNKLAWTPDGRRLASHSDPGEVFLWDPARGEAVLTLHKQPEAEAMAWSADGQILAVGSYGGDTIHLYDGTPTP